MKIACFDLSHIFRMQWEVTKGKPSEDPVKRTLDYIRERREGFDVAVIACDAIVDDAAMGLRSATSFRAKIDPPRDDPKEPGKRIGYKANRESPGAAFYEQQKRLLGLLRRDGCHAYVGPEVEPGFYAEADDVMGWVAARYIEAAEANIGDGADPADWRLQIVSGDMDMFSLIDPMLDITVLSPQAGKIYDDQAVMAHPSLGVAPAKIRQFKALAGDKSDGFFPFRGPIIKKTGRRSPGVGVETARALLAEFGDAMSAVRAAMAVPPPASITNHIVGVLKAGGEAAVQRGLALATLKTDLALDFTPVLDGPLPLNPEPPVAWEPPVAVPSLPPEQAQSGAAAIPAHQASSTEAIAAEPSQTATSAPAHAVPAKESDAPMVMSRQATIIDPGKPEWALALQPQSAQEAFIMARHLFAGGLFKRFGNAESIWTVIMLGREYGLSALSALQGIVLIDGKPEFAATLIAALVLRSGKAKRFGIVESTDERAVYEAQRTEDAKPMLVEFTREHAERRKLWGKDNWMKMPDVMLAARCCVKAARLKFPDVTRNLYGEGELQEARVYDMTGESR